MRQLSTSYVLAPQQLVSCDTEDSGCNGGWPTNAYDYIESIGGMVQETDCTCSILYCFNKQHATRKTNVTH